jgi:uncharacterized protein YjdB
MIKNKLKLFVIAVFIAVFVFGACDNGGGGAAGGGGSLTISVGDGGRAMLSDGTNTNSLTHEITIIDSSGKIRSATIQPGGGSANFSSLAVGWCDILVQGKLGNVLKTEGNTRVNIKVGPNGTVPINMNFVGTGNVPVTGVTLQQTLNMIVGDSCTLTAQIAPVNAANKTVTWTSSDTSVATVNNGVVEAKKEGTAVITVTTQDGGKTASCTVTVLPVGSKVLTGTVTITGNPYVGETLTANTSQLGGDGIISYQWKRGTTNVGTNNATYVVQTADVVGSSISVTVTRAGFEGSATSAAIVIAQTYTITLPIASFTMTKGPNIQLKATTDAENVTWISSNTGVATVNNGVITAVTAGKTTITATTGGSSANCSVTVLNDVPAGQPYNTDFTGAEHLFEFNVATTEEWNGVVSIISSNGNYRNYVINVTNNFSIDGKTDATFGSVTGIKVSIRGNKTLTLSGPGNMIKIQNQQTVILRETTLNGNGSNNTSLVYLTDNNNEFIMQSGEISNNTSTGDGGGVYVGASGGTFRMNGGNISGNTATNGGGVYVNSGEFEMNPSAIIYNNTATNNGGGVYVASGQSIMTDGIISSNRANNGGGVYVHNVGTFTMRNSEISDNRATVEGGGVYLASATTAPTPGGTFIMEGGTIGKKTATDKGNEAARGGGVYTSGNFDMSGNSEISGNKATNGGGIYSLGGKTEMRNGEINENTATEKGGGVSGMFGPYEFRIINGKFYGNTAPSFRSVYNEVGFAIAMGNYEGSQWKIYDYIQESDSDEIIVEDGIITKQ